MFKGLILIDNENINYSLDLIDVVRRLAGNEEACIYGLGINLPEKVKGLDAVISVEAPARNGFWTNGSTTFGDAD